MGKINVLGFDIANLIAAGEVVDRPASVVKELCENSIDAGAKTITVEIRRGGISFIRVSDNGTGIEPEDMPLTVLRHATSKIATAEDLSAICTLGFRGEALSAIAAVCKLKMVSKTDGFDMGYTMLCEGGEIIDLYETGCSHGTTVIAEELFYNVPARRKFLKKDATEAAAVSAVVEKIALSCPDISVQFISDNEVKFKTPGDGEIRSAIYSVFGRSVAERMTRVDRTSAEGIRVSGYSGEPDLVRGNKNAENFFINGRFVKSRTAMAAIEQAYATRIPAGKFPVCVLNISLNPEAVDVNVHPSKLEVKFSNERIIFEAVYYAVLNTLQTAVSRPEMKINIPMPSPAAIPEPYAPKKAAVVSRITDTAVQEKKTKPSETSEAAEATKKYLENVRRAEVLNPFVQARQRGDGKSEPSQLAMDIPEEIKEKPKKKEAPKVEPQTAPETVAVTAAEKETEKETEKEKIPEYRIIGEAYKCYVIVEVADRLLMIDKHAAHERILFDEMCRRMSEKKKHSQMLMFPIPIPVSYDEIEALTENSEKIKDMGFEYTVEKGNTVSVSAIPDELNRETAESMLSELLSRLADSTGSVETMEAKYFEAKLFQASCKAAIKGGRIYDEAHLKWICDKLLKAPDENGAVIKTCPHGRPVAFEIKKTSIERQFERIV